VSKPANGQLGGCPPFINGLGMSTGVVGEIDSYNQQGGVDVLAGVGKLDNSTATKQLAPTHCPDSG
jgi:hypothetical protein